MNNKLIVAAAGSGKTTHLIEEALKIENKKVLITTFTEANKNEIRKKFFDLKGYIPSNITIQTWFSFLIQHGVKPYQSILYNHKVKGLLLVNQKSGLHFYTKSKKPIYYGENDPSNHYFNKSQLIYSDKLAKFVVKVNELTDGRIVKRIEKIYSSIFIDEVQDFSGYDLEIIKSLFASNSNILLVGDPRQVTYHTHYEEKYKKYSNGNIIEFINEECSSYSVEIDNISLNKTYRNNKSICYFANFIFPNFKPCEAIEQLLTGHDGVFFVSKTDVDKYLAKYKPMQLRDTSRRKVNIDYPVITFGSSKGLTFERVIIYPTDNMIQWFFDHNKELKNQSRSKLYVAITRAKYSVAIVFDNNKNQLAKGILDYKM
jgi:superfamily I DNA and RNA helicases